MADIYSGTEPYGYVHEGGGILRRVSWGALFAGLVVSLVVMLVLTLLGMGIGLGVINPATEENPFGGVGIGAAIWLGVTALIALFFGGWTTAKLAGSIRGLNGVLHSIVMWGLVTIASFFLVSTVIGSLVSGVAGIVGKSMSAVGSGVAAVAPEAGRQIQQELSKRGISLDSIMNEAKQMLSKGEGAKGAGAGGGTGTQGVEQELRQTLQRIFSSGQQVSATDRETLVNTLVSKANMSRPEAERTVGNWIQQYQQVAQSAQQAKQQALQTTEKAMGAMSKAGLWLFVLLVLEAAAAAFGGWLGSSREDIVATRKV